jgi:hypothetical protein
VITPQTRKHTEELKGNRCGHDSQSPKIYALPTVYKSRPKIITQAKYRANGVALGRSWHNPAYLLHYKESRRNDVSLRQQRTEGRSRFAQVAGVILDHTDLEMMQVGRWDKKTGMFSPYSWQELWIILLNNQGENESFSRDRFYQEIRRFQAAGYIRVQKRHYETGEENADGTAEVRQDVAHKWVCSRFFEDLALSIDELKKARKVSSDKNDKLRMTAAVSQCANNPLAKAAEAVVKMFESAKNGEYSKVRKYYEQKKAQYNLNKAAKTSPAPAQQESNTQTSQSRTEKIERLMASSGCSRQQAEKLIHK